MPVYQLNEEFIFPHPSLADESGLLAYGGDLNAERLVQSYANGIFPWYSKGEPILWWSPDPRMVLFPEKLKVSKSLKQSLNNKSYEVKFDTNFKAVIEQCSTVPRDGQNGTWITEEMKMAYIHLNKLGIAHSVETYLNTELVGGLYGVSIGSAFFGESMFQTKTDASKVALFYLVKKIKEWDFKIIDAQVETDHMKNMGAENISRDKFLEILKIAIKAPTIKGKW
jgi:leucyl/phenylalanyl-tRNA--protein transferase